MTAPMPINEPWPGSYRCDACFQWVGGSHYHCARCGAETGMYGHYRSIHIRNGQQIEVAGHQCCPDDCSLPVGQTFDEAVERLLRDTT